MLKGYAMVKARMAAQQSELTAGALGLPDWEGQTSQTTTMPMTTCELRVVNA